MLEEDFSELEIWEAIQECDGNRAPGPDGFNITFFKEFWNIIKAEIIQVFCDFHVHGKLVRGLNATFIALIPKSDHPASASDYRPISLIGSVYKLIAKVLAGRLQKVMPYLLTETQFAFTKGRQIADCIMIENEVVDAMNKSEDGGITLKLDFSKAYDNVD